METLEQLFCSVSHHDGSRSPRRDGLDGEADLLASVNTSDCSTEEERPGMSLAIATSGAEEPEADAEADSCGYDGDVGEGNKKLAASSRRGSVLSHPLPGFSTNRVRCLVEIAGTRVHAQTMRSLAAPLSTQAPFFPRRPTSFGFVVWSSLDDQLAGRS